MKTKHEYGDGIPIHQFPAFVALQILMDEASKELYYASMGNKAAARRARKVLHKIREAAKICREQVLVSVIGKSEPQPKPPPKALPPQNQPRNLDLSEDA